MVGQFKRRDPLAHPPRHFVDRKTIRSDRIPQAKKSDFRHRVGRQMAVFRLVTKKPAHRARDVPPICVKVSPMIAPVGLGRFSLQFGFGQLLGRYQPLV